MASVLKNIKRIKDTLANVIASLGDGKTALLTDQNNEHIHRVGSYFFFPNQSKKTTDGVSFTYLDSENKDVIYQGDVIKGGISKSDLWDSTSDNALLKDGSVPINNTWDIDGTGLITIYPSTKSVRVKDGVMLLNKSFNDSLVYLRLYDDVSQTGIAFLVGNKIIEYLSQSNTASISFNYSGYNYTTGYFRDFEVFNGKNASILKLTGSTKNAVFTGDITISADKNFICGLSSFCTDTVGIYPAAQVKHSTGAILLLPEGTSQATSPFTLLQDNLEIKDCIFDLYRYSGTESMMRLYYGVSKALITAINTGALGTEFIMSDSTGITIKGGTNHAATFLPTGAVNLGISDALVVSTASKVGIGTSAPTHALHVIQSTGSTVTAVLDDLTTMAANVGASLQFRGKFKTDGSVTDGAKIKMYKANATDNNNSFGLTFQTRLNGAVTTERMRINESGNVGILTTAPITTFDVAGKSGMTAEGGFAVFITAGENLSRGNVVYQSQSGTADRVLKTPAGNEMPIGVIYADVSSGSVATVVVSGIAYVKGGSAVTITQGHVIYTHNSEAGVVLSSASVPAAADHFREVGHALTSASGAGGLAKCVIHFN